MLLNVIQTVRLTREMSVCVLFFLILPFVWFPSSQRRPKEDQKIVPNGFKLVVSSLKLILKAP
jgi:MFS-type transporter involved in bile tolerance (Atg22 family)